MYLPPTDVIFIPHFFLTYSEFDGNISPSIGDEKDNIPSSA